MRRGVVAVLAGVLFTGCSPADDIASPSPRPSPETSVTPAAPALPNPVFVYLLRGDGDVYRRGDYDRMPRPSHGARGPGERLQVALHELARGATRRERLVGYSSAFSRETADVLARVELRGRRVVIDFRDFRRDQGQWGTSNGGSMFLMQLTQTVFQFDRVRSALFRIDRSCKRFWTFLQAGGCELVHRGGDRTPRP